MLSFIVDEHEILGIGIFKRIRRHRTFLSQKYLSRPY
jgi:hypothetical protein